MKIINRRDKQKSGEVLGFGTDLLRMLFKAYYDADKKLLAASVDWSAEY